MKDVISERRREVFSQIKRNPKDERAWADLYTEFWPTVFAHSYRLLSGNHQEAREASHEVFVRLAKYCPFERIRSAEHLIGYLKASCYNVARDFYRQKSRYIQAPAEFFESHAGFVESQASIHDRVGNILDALLEALDPAERHLLRILIRGSSGREIAHELKISESSARIRIHRLRAKIRRMEQNL